MLAPPREPSQTEVGEKKKNPLRFLSRISPITWVYLFIVIAVVIFIGKNWDVLRWLGLAAALVAALPFMADVVAAIVGGIGIAISFSIWVFQHLRKQFNASGEDAAAEANEMKDGINDVDEAIVQEGAGDPTGPTEAGLTELVVSAQVKVQANLTRIQELQSRGYLTDEQAQALATEGTTADGLTLEQVDELLAEYEGLIGDVKIHMAAFPALKRMPPEHSRRVSAGLRRVTRDTRLRVLRLLADNDLPPWLVGRAFNS